MKSWCFRANRHKKFQFSFTIFPKSITNRLLLFSCLIQYVVRSYDQPECTDSNVILYEHKKLRLRSVLIQIEFLVVRLFYIIIIPVTLKRTFYCFKLFSATNIDNKIRASSLENTLKDFFVRCPTNIPFFFCVFFSLSLKYRINFI